MRCVSYRSNIGRQFQIYCRYCCILFHIPFWTRSFFNDGRTKDQRIIMSNQKDWCLMKKETWRPTSMSGLEWKATEKKNQTAKIYVLLTFPFFGTFPLSPVRVRSLVVASLFRHLNFHWNRNASGISFNLFFVRFFFVVVLFFSLPKPIRVSLAPINTCRFSLALARFLILFGSSVEPNFMRFIYTSYTSPKSCPRLLPFFLPSVSHQMLLTHFGYC